jgi:hypothetical protein
VSKETYYSVKRALLQCQKSPTIVSPVTRIATAPGGIGNERVEEHGLELRVGYRRWGALL